MSKFTFPADCKSRLRKLSTQEYLDMIPPENLRDIVGKSSQEQYIRIGLGARKTMINSGLRQTDSVLDIGCGCGRMAIALVDFLLPTASYDGFDILPAGIQWCQEQIGRKHPNFKFHCAQLFNNTYHDGMLSKDGSGKSIDFNESTDASRFIFPYKDQKFDFAFATSVFTHMTGNEIENYLSEIFRVLKPGGICHSTFFILENVGQDAAFNFVHSHQKGFSHNTTKPLAAIAFKEEYLRSIIKDAGFEIRSITYGGWRGKGYTGGPQDRILFFKPDIQ